MSRSQEMVPVRIVSPKQLVQWIGSTGKDNVVVPLTALAGAHEVKMLQKMLKREGYTVEFFNSNNLGRTVLVSMVLSR